MLRSFTPRKWTYKKWISMFMAVVWAVALMPMLPGGAQALTVRKGDKGALVERIQTDLAKKKYLSKKHVSGVFDQHTVNAVKKLQKKVKLKATGVVTDTTLKKLWGKQYKALAKKYKPYKTVKKGDKSARVKLIQTRLIKLGYGEGKADGVFGSGTKAAVKRFQKQIKRKTTGAVDKATYDKLFAKKAPKYKKPKSSKPKPFKTLKQGSASTKTIKAIQKRLKKLGYYKSSASGTYGYGTYLAVRSFQKLNKLSVSGDVTKATYDKLSSKKAVKYHTSAKKPSSKPPKKVPGKKPSTPNRGRAAKVIAEAMKHLGKRYVFASDGPNTFDCSGFTQYAFGKLGIYLPHSARYQGNNYGTLVTRSNLQKGDLVFFNTTGAPGRCSHVGIYLGGDKFIHASSGKPNNVVKISSLSESYYSARFSWGRRLL